MPEIQVVPRNRHEKWRHHRKGLYPALWPEEITLGFLRAFSRFHRLEIDHREESSEPQLLRCLEIKLVSP